MVDVSTSAIVAALVSTGFISLAPNLILFAFPHYGATAEHHHRTSTFLSLGQALAAGGLLGDVFLHTLPHAAAASDGGHNHDDPTGLYVLLGFTIFLAVDMLIRSLEEGSSHHHHHYEDDVTTETNGGGTSDITKQTNGSTSDNKKETSSFLPHLLSSTVLLNLAADALHNFTDGIAIGASFASSSTTLSDQQPSVMSLLTSRGGIATLSVLFHEIPHELGDFCILVKGGFSKSQAIAAQFMTAVAAMVGTLVGLWAAAEDQDAMIFITAGGFVYLAAVNILPELLDEENTSKWMRCAQLLAFGMGIAFLYAVSLLEEHDHHSRGGHDHHHHSHVVDDHMHHEHHHAEHDHHHAEL